MRISKQSIAPILSLRFKGFKAKISLNIRYFTQQWININQADLNLKANSGSRQNMIVKLNTLQATATAGAKINIKGSAKYQELSATTGAEIMASKVENEEANVVSTTGALIDVSTTKDLKVNSKIGGIINVHTKTDKITEKISVGGVVNYLYDD